MLMPSLLEIISLRLNILFDARHRVRKDFRVPKKVLELAIEIATEPWRAAINATHQLIAVT